MERPDDLTIQAHIAGVFADSSVKKITDELYEDIKACRLVDKK